MAILCGGPSLERGISLNSARSVLDHLHGEKISVLPIYFDQQKNAYKISKAQLYSNTPSDFDFKLRQSAIPLTKSELIRLLKTTDITFPVMHGSFGEDGGIQSLLERYKIPYLGSGAEACKKIFDKHISNEYLQRLGFYTLPSALLKIFHDDHLKILQDFFSQHQIKRAVVKPASGGSSIGVFSVSTAEEALSKASLIFSKRMDTRVVVEPFAEGREFTVIILQNRFGLPVALLPTEIEADYEKHQIFDFRKKYLPTRQVAYHCPPRFSNDVVEKIQVQAEHLFAAFGLRDFARFDGWVMPDGKIWFSDFNPVSGMEQNSFLFQQGSRVGLTHRGILHFILKSACRRYDISFPDNPEPVEIENPKRKPVQVLFGGSTSERQVSLMSGTNVWLKLRQSKQYSPKPFLLRDEEVWELPYAYTLNHTVEEIAANCEKAKSDLTRLENLVKRVHLRLGLENGDQQDYLAIPRKLTLKEFIKEASFVFIALHGGMGENGVLQGLLENERVKYNGSGPQASKLCMDKWETGCLVKKIQISGVDTSPKKAVPSADLLKMGRLDLASFWKNLLYDLKTKSVIVKPRSDGCSSGIVHLYSDGDLADYLELIRQRATSIPKNTFRNQMEPIEIGQTEALLFEKYIRTDSLHVKGNQLKYTPQTGWVEVTIGVVQEGEKIRVFNPSITVAEGEVLSVEEKFQGGTGVNITPPPAEIINLQTLTKIKKRIAKLAKALTVDGYARLDAFVNVKSGDIILIEVNTLPGLTPSTVLYHQALAERPAIFPGELLEILIANRGY